MTHKRHSSTKFKKEDSLLELNHRDNKQMQHNVILCKTNNKQQETYRQLAI